VIAHTCGPAHRVFDENLAIAAARDASPTYADAAHAALDAAIAACPACKKGASA